MPAGGDPNEFLAELGKAGCKLGCIAAIALAVALFAAGTLIG